MNKFLIIQTAFIGDVVLATALVEAIWNQVPEAKIDFLLRKGNESLLENNPCLRTVLVWDKKSGKYSNLVGLLRIIRSEKYDAVINLQRFAASGLLTALSKSKHRLGFDKNPFSFFFTKTFPHSLSQQKHEVERNHALIKHFAPNQFLPKLYPSAKEKEIVSPYQKQPYVCIAPSSVWFTKQLPKEKWIELINTIPKELKIYLIGAKSDKNYCDEITKTSDNIENLCGKLSLLASCALMEKAKMNFVNDSAPMHFASAMNAPTTAFFCSTIPEFGFGPLAKDSRIVQTEEKLDCRPCGLHGHKKCPRNHFKCAYTINVEHLITTI